MQILFIGDIFGSGGRKIVRDHLSHLVETNKVDLVIANAENAAGGFGLTPAIADELFDLGCHVLTTGNHVWDKREIVDYFNSANGDPRGRVKKVLRPAIPSATNVQRVSGRRLITAPINEGAFTAAIRVPTTIPRRNP